MVLRNFKQWKKQMVLSAVLAGSMFLTAGFTMPVRADNSVMPAGMHQVNIHVDGRTITEHTTYTSPTTILSRAGVELGSKDEYKMTKTDEKHTDITIRRAVPITIEYNGQKKTILTGKDTVGEVLVDNGYVLADYDVNPGLNAEVSENTNIELTDSAAKIAEEQAASQPEPANSIDGVGSYNAVYYMEASAYLPWDGGGSGITASGMPAQYGVAAVDTDVIPLGTRLYIPGYGIAIAADTGGAIYGNRIDLCMEDYGSAMQFGRRDVTVYVLD